MPSNTHTHTQAQPHTSPAAYSQTDDQADKQVVPEGSGTTEHSGLFQASMILREVLVRLTVKPFKTRYINQTNITHLM